MNKISTENELKAINPPEITSQLNITWVQTKWKVINIVWEKDYSYLIEKPLDYYSKKELKYTEELLTSHTKPITKKEKKLIDWLKEKYPMDLLNRIYNSIIKLKLNDSHNPNIKALVADQDKESVNRNTTVLIWKYKTCNWFWIPFILDWDKYKVITKINHDTVCDSMWIHSEFDSEPTQIYWLILNQEWIWLPFWYNKEKQKYTSLKQIEWIDITNTQTLKRKQWWKVQCWEFKSKNHNFRVPFWFSSKTKSYKALHIEWETIYDTKNLTRGKYWKVLYWRYVNQEKISIPFWLEWDKYIPLKIEWDNIKRFTHIERDNNGKVISWSFENKKWTSKKFKLDWWKYIIKEWMLKRFKNLFNS